MTGILRTLTVQLEAARARKKRHGPIDDLADNGPAFPYSGRPRPLSSAADDALRTEAFRPGGGRGCLDVVSRALPERNER